MTRCGFVPGWRWARRSACMLVVAAACSAAVPQQALAAQVQAYVLFEIAASANTNAAAEKLRGTSLSNCLQLIIGQRARDVIVHIACDERGDDRRYLNEAFLQLSRVDGIARATVVSVKQGAE